MQKVTTSASIPAREVTQISAVFNNTTDGMHHEFVGFPESFKRTLEMLKDIHAFMPESGATSVNVTLRNIHNHEELVTLYADPQ